MLVFRSSLLAKWLRERVRVRVRPRARECITFFPLVLQYVGKIVVFVGLVPSCESMMPNRVNLVYILVSQARPTSTKRKGSSELRMQATSHHTVQCGPIMLQSDFDT